MTTVESLRLIAEAAEAALFRHQDSGPAIPFSDVAYSDEMARLQKAYTEAMDAYLAAAVASHRKPETPDTLESARLTGRVKFWNPTKQFGYIIARDGREFYMQGSAALCYADMPIATGSTVTFSEVVSVSENAGMPRAKRVMVEGYTPPQKAAYTAPESVVTAAQSINARRKAALAKAKADKVEREAANKRAMGDMRRVTWTQDGTYDIDDTRYDDIEISF